MSNLSPTLYALIVRLIATRNGRPRATQGHLAHAASLNILLPSRQSPHHPASLSKPTWLNTGAANRLAHPRPGPFWPWPFLADNEG